jgi:hypothetical protein
MFREVVAGAEGIVVSDEEASAPDPRSVDGDEK